MGDQQPTAIRGAIPVGGRLFCLWPVVPRVVEVVIHRNRSRCAWDGAHDVGQGIILFEGIS
jgi:hypothetical protein